MRQLRTWIERSVGRSVVRLRPMRGATSSTLYEAVLDRGPSLVVRAFTNAAWLDQEPDLAQHEAAALELLRAADLPTPELVAVDPIGAEAATPAVLMTLLPGTVELPERPPDSWLRALTELPAQLHDVEPAEFAWQYDPWIGEPQAPPAWSDDPALWEEAFDRYRCGLPAEDFRLLHRDYHPANVLWVDGHVSGIVDWVNASVGPPSADTAHCRLNLALMYGPEIGDRFAAVLETPYDPVWDLVSALSVLSDLAVYPPWREFGLAGLTLPLIRRRLEAFVRQSLTV